MITIIKKHQALVLSIILLIMGLWSQYSGFLKGYALYIVPSLLWLIAFHILYPKIRFDYGRMLGFIIFASLVTITIPMVEGVFFGWGINTLDVRLIGIVVNMARFIPYIVLLESLRVYVIDNFRKSPQISGRYVVAITLVFTLLYIPLSKLLYPPSDIQGIIKLLVKTILPVFSLNIFLVYIAFIGGALSSVIYLFMINIHKYFLPVLPAIPWFVEGFTSIIVYLVLLTILISDRIDLGKQVFNTNIRLLTWREIIAILTYVMVLGIMVSLIITNSRPFVIVSGSMKPSINIGDIVIIKGLNYNESINKGDVIAFITVNKDVVIHRVVDIEYSDNEVHYRTKGDANRDLDPWVVKRDSVLGKAILVIPKLGLPIILFWMCLVHYPYITIIFIVSVALLYTYIPRIREYFERRI